MPFVNRLLWNAQDWVARIKGRFENRFGAHAGFTSRELRGILTERFPIVEDISDQYYLLKYPTSRLIKSLVKLPWLKSWLWPSVYFICHKSIGNDR